MTDQLVKALVGQLSQAVGLEFLNRIGQNEFMFLSQEIGSYKDRYDAETDPEEKRQLEKDIRFLESSLIFREEIKKLKLSKKAEAALKTATKTVLRSQFPILAAL